MGMCSSLQDFRASLQQLRTSCWCVIFPLLLPDPLLSPLTPTASLGTTPSKNGACSQLQLPVIQAQNAAFAHGPLTGRANRICELEFWQVSMFVVGPEPLHLVSRTPYSAPSDSQCAMNTGLGCRIGYLSRHCLGSVPWLSAVAFWITVVPELQH